jgi:hypothetical protein
LVLFPFAPPFSKEKRTMGFKQLFANENYQKVFQNPKRYLLAILVSLLALLSCFHLV